MEAADFYTGLVAELYEPLRGSAPDPAEYIALVRRFGEPALELGCGGGDPLIVLRRAGLDVEGVDSSPDILKVCRAKAHAAGVDVTLHAQRMEDLSLGRWFPLIFLAGPTVNLLTDDATVLRALSRIAEHLAPGGVAWIPLFVPEPLAPDEVGMTREAVDERGDRISVSFLSQDRDEAART
ncbi:class I SAM-dependent methyltransferase [Tessaracoccus sp.]|uniref:class I SAM-dependent methyltransferase n=1 Tax=Tessaracoccus sp. TaxID=1971211 RepID=UPI002629A31E|nr:class I SAM-dependent methyltransferase [Tessaracoccus sp.]